MSYKIREYDQSIDKNYVLTHWFKSRKSNEARFVSLNQATYDKYLYDSIQKTVDLNKLKIACDENDKSIIFGFICFNVYESHLVIHYIFIKQAFRKFKIATKLVEDAKSQASDQDQIIITYRNKNIKLDNYINYLPDLKY